MHAQCLLLILIAVGGCSNRVHGALTIIPFPLADVRIADTTAQGVSAALNHEYLMLLDTERLLWTFRKNANLPTPSTVYEGTWEDGNCEVRGQFMGHYMTALSFAWLSTGNDTFKSRIEYLVRELNKVQKALGEGYLSAFPKEHFDRLQALRPVWSPYYVIHKIINGLLDAHELTGIADALPMATAMAAYFLQRIDLTLKINGTGHWHQMLENEFGGMNDVMYRMHSITQDPEHLRMAHLFDKPVFYDPLVQGMDPLPGRHANTHLAQVVGFASRYDVVGDSAARSAVSSFFSALVANHSYATGGSNVHEFWFQPNRLGDAIQLLRHATETQETCTTYNVLKIARSLFRWTGDVRYVDFYESALLNSILGVNRLPPAAVSQVRRREAATAAAAAASGKLLRKGIDTGAASGTHDHAHDHHALAVPKHQRQYRSLPSVPDVGPHRSLAEGHRHQHQGHDVDEQGRQQGPTKHRGGFNLQAHIPHPDLDEAELQPRAQHDHPQGRGSDLGPDPGLAHRHQVVPDEEWVFQPHEHDRQQHHKFEPVDPNWDTKAQQERNEWYRHLWNQGHAQAKDKAALHAQHGHSRPAPGHGPGHHTDQLQGQPQGQQQDAHNAGQHPDQYQGQHQDAHNVGQHRDQPQGQPQYADQPGPGSASAIEHQGQHQGQQKPSDQPTPGQVAQHQGQPEAVDQPQGQATGQASGPRQVDVEMAPMPNEDRLAKSGAAGRVDAGVMQHRRRLAARQGGISSVGWRGGSAVAPHERQRASPTWHGPPFGLPSTNTSAQPGPGEYLYFLPMGAGNSKGDSSQHWGTPFNSFWCCYGTAIESFAKLADSIFFRDDKGGPDGVPLLYVTQLASATLTWRQQGVVVTQDATMYGPDHSAVSTLKFTVSAAGGGADLAVKVRVPGWVEGSPVVQVNGQDWTDCPGSPTPGSFCQIRRRWSSGDEVRCVLRLRYWAKALPDDRPVLRRFQAVMAGPLLMAGLTHDTRDIAATPDSLADIISDPQGYDNTLSLRSVLHSAAGAGGGGVGVSGGAAWLRVDRYHAFVSHLRDGGDALDATWRTVSGDCPFMHRPNNTYAGQAGSPSSALPVGGLVYLEAVGQPGFFLAHDSAAVLTLRQLSARDAALYAARGGREQEDLCRKLGWRVRAALDGTPGAISLENDYSRGSYVSVAGGSDRAPCADMAQSCRQRAALGDCDFDPESMLTQCRRSCGHCEAVESALTLRNIAMTGGMTRKEFAAAASFVVEAGVGALPLGAKVLEGFDRKYIIAPLGNLVDERYTAYFWFKDPPTWSADDVALTLPGDPAGARQGSRGAARRSRFRSRGEPATGATRRRAT